MSYKNTPSSIKNAVTRADTAFVKEEFSTTVKLLEGSEITYSPASGAERVIYECQFTTAWNPDSQKSLPCVRLQYSDDSGVSWTTVDGSQSFLGNFSTSHDYNWHLFFFVHSLAPWTGSRLLRLAGRSYDSSTEWILGRAYLLSSSEGDGACPIVKCFSVM